MPKSLVLTALLITAAATPTASQAAERGYLALGVGTAAWHRGSDASLAHADYFPVTRYDLDTRSPAASLRAGYLWRQHPHIALEAGLVSLGRWDLHWKTSIPDYAQDARVSELVRAVTFGAQWRGRAQASWHPSLRAGLWYGRSDRKFYDWWISVYQTLQTYKFYGDDQHLGVYAGLGIERDLGQHYRVALEYDHYTNRFFGRAFNTGLASAVLSYRF